MTDFDPQTDTGFLDTSAPRSVGDDGDPGSDPLAGGWSAERARMLGALIEKALATPQNYPLSLNALTMACNQTTNRDPIMDLGDGAVERLLDDGKADGLLRFIHPRGRGVTKYRHVVDEALGLDTEQTALLGVLLLRGPQTVSELRSRSERLAGFVDNGQVEEVLGAMAEHSPRPLVRRLEREAGHREQRWIQLLCASQGEDRVGEPAGASPRRSSAGATAEVTAEVGELRAELETVKADLAELRDAFNTFRAEFG